MDQLLNNNNAEPLVPCIIRAAISVLKHRKAESIPDIYQKEGNRIKVLSLKETLRDVFSKKTKFPKILFFYQNISLVSNDISYQKARRAILKQRDVTTITSFIKSFFTDYLIEPILTFEGLAVMCKLVMDEPANSYRTNTKLINNIKEFISELQSSNISTLSMVILHCKSILEDPSHRRANSLDGLCNALAPSIIGTKTSKPTPKELKNAIRYQSKVFKALVSVENEFWEKYYSDELFGDCLTEEKSYSGSSVLEKARQAVKAKKY